MPKMVFSWLGDFLLTVNTNEAPTEAEWEEYVASIMKHDILKVRNLVITDGGAPNSSQRKILNEALKGRSVPAAVVSPSAMVRGVVTALNWFNPKIKAFAPGDMNEAFRYLGVRDSEVPAITAEVRRLRALVASAPWSKSS